MSERAEKIGTQWVETRHERIQTKQEEGAGNIPLDLHEMCEAKVRQQTWKETSCVQLHEIPQERISARGQLIGVPKTSRR